MRLDDIAKMIGAEIVAASADAVQMEITGVAPIEHATAGTISFIASSAYQKFLPTTKASALVTMQAIADCTIPQLVHKNPYLAFAKISLEYYRPTHGYQGVSPQAFVADSAELGPDVSLFPFSYVGPGAKLGRGTILYPGAYVGTDATVGDHTILHANVVVGDRCQVGNRVLIHGGTVIGADGFGFAKADGEIVKIPQTGIVVIEDDVELGACCTVDRATMGQTRIKRMTKFDSRVHVGHNVEIGEYCLFSAQSGVAGSTKIGNWVTVGGNVGFGNNLEIKDGVTIGAKAGVISNLGPGGVFMGFPAVPAQQWRKQHVYVKRIPDYEKRVKELEKRLAELEQRL